ncbi:RNA polymerase sigma-70 factor [Prolixibacteraceae bacterium Z1-6]|uniref:RNA polymerase sigma-70 factor n=1 Tax=Draconibacterium aestuarii TaxID=2998507 RepID=A0A9X3J7Y7_9BACT|nr:RNA polymerase sigma-70 factor [Prolixibacteraceae bacterium Z1-6]
MYNDKLIINEIRNGNSIVFEKVFHEHYNSLIKFANQFLLDNKISEDVVQGVFIYFWENSDSIQIKTSVKAYLYQAVKNSSLNQLRALKIRDKYQLLYLEAMLETSEPDWMNDCEIVESIKQSLQQLPKQMCRIFYKKYFQEQSIKEIAKEMSLSENTIKVQLYKGRHAIRQILELATSYFFIF